MNKRKMKEATQEVIGLLFLAVIMCAIGFVYPESRDPPEVKGVIKEISVLSTEKLQKEVSPAEIRFLITLSTEKDINEAVFEKLQEGMELHLTIGTVEGQEVKVLLEHIKTPPAHAKSSILLTNLSKDFTQ
jgi:hypothetical protein